MKSLSGSCRTGEDGTMQQVDVHSMDREMQVRFLRVRTAAQRSTA